MKRRASYDLPRNWKTRAWKTAGGIAAALAFQRRNQLAAAMKKWFRRYKKKKARAGNRTAREIKYRFPDSHTKTKTEKDEDNLIEISQHNDLSLHKLSSVYLHRKAKKMQGKVKARETYQRISNGDQGKQAVDYLEMIFNRDKVIGTTSANRNNLFLAAYDYFELNTQSQHNNTTLLTANAFNDNIARSIVVKGLGVTLEAISLCNVPAIVTVMFVTPKFDTFIDPIQAWGNLINAQGFGNTVVQGPTTIADPLAQPGKDSINNWGGYPEKTSGWSKQWSVLKKKTFVLQPGDQRNYHFYLGMNYAFRRQTFQTVRTCEYLKGLTVIPIVIVKGGLVGLATDEVTTSEAAEVGHAPTKVGFSTTYDYSFGFKSTPNLPVQFTQQDLVRNLNKDRVRIIDDVDDRDVEKFA